MQKFISLNNSRDNIPHPCVVHWLHYSLCPCG